MCLVNVINVIKEQICITNQNTKSQHKNNTNKTLYTTATSPHPMVGTFDFSLEKFGGPEKGRFVVIGAGHLLVS